MGSVIILLASQVLALTAPAAPAPLDAPGPRGAQVSAAATVVILHAETTRAEAGAQALKRQRLTSAEGRVTIAFE